MPAVYTNTLPSRRGERCRHTLPGERLGNRPRRSTFVQVTPRVPLPTGSAGEVLPRTSPLLPRCVARGGAVLGGETA